MTDRSTIVEDAAAVDIRVSRVVVRGFRCLREARLDLSPGTTYLVGENNSGKTSILLALWSALGSRRPVDDDLRREGDGALADEASVDLLIVPAKGVRGSCPRRRRSWYMCSAIRHPAQRPWESEQRSCPAERTAFWRLGAHSCSPTSMAAGSLPSRQPCHRR